ncbi:hypothetical protein HRbin40_00504 [bacterium HR40]|nr:hypothetical protein HRbin40_00504 [bacterium HR40]
MSAEEEASVSRGSVRDLLLLASARAVATGAGFLVALLLARALGPRDYGTWAMLVALQGQALLLADCGLRSVATADCGLDAARLRATLWRYLGLRLALASVVTGLGLPVAWALTSATGPALWLFSCLFASALFCDWIALARGRSLEAALPLALRPLSFASGLALLLLVSPALSLDAVAFCCAISWWLAALASLPAVRHLPPPRGHPTATPSLLRRALPLGASSVLAQLLLGLDVLLLGWWLDAAQAGIYQLAAGVLTAALVFANAAGQLVLARAGRLRGESPTALTGPTFRLFGLLATGGGLAVGIGLLAPLLLPLVFGEPFAASVAVLHALLPWFVLQHAGSFLVGLASGLARERAVLAAHLWALAVFALALPVALWSGDLAWVALCRGLAELVRCLQLSFAILPRRHHPSSVLTPARGATSP